MTTKYKTTKKVHRRKFDDVQICVYYDSCHNLILAGTPVKFFVLPEMRKYFSSVTCPECMEKGLSTLIIEENREDYQNGR